MGPRIYPSYQQLPSQDSIPIIVSFFEGNVLTSSAYFNILVNGVEREIDYSNIEGKYTLNIRNNDIVVVTLYGGYQRQLSLSAIKRKYTTDDVNSDNGISDVLIQNTSGFTTSLSISFTGITDSPSYHSEYRLNLIASPDPTPTPTPSPTPTNTPTPSPTPDCAISDGTAVQYWGLESYHTSEEFVPPGIYQYPIIELTLTGATSGDTIYMRFYTSTSRQNRFVVIDRGNNVQFDTGYGVGYVNMTFTYDSTKIYYLQVYAGDVYSTSNDVWQVSISKVTFRSIRSENTYWITVPYIGNSYPTNLSVYSSNPSETKTLIGGTINKNLLPTGTSYNVVWVNGQTKLYFSGGTFCGGYVPTNGILLTNPTPLPTYTPTPTPSPTPTPTATPTSTPTPTPTPAPINLTFAWNGGLFTSGCTKNVRLEYSIDSGTTYTQVLGYSTTTGGYISSTGSTIQILEGTFNGFRIRRRICKGSNCGAGTINITDSFSNIRPIGGNVIVSSSTGVDQTVPLCTSSDAIRTFSFSSFNMSAPDSYLLTFGDTTG